MFNQDDILKKGFIDLPLDNSIDLIKEIKKLKKEKNAILLAHFYQTGGIQDIADIIGDSLKLAQEAEKTDADIIVMGGVHFMAETAKILSPSKKVLIPDTNAGCSLATSCQPKDFEKFVRKNPDHTVISYVNTTAEIKALTDIVCTSTNAMQIVQNLPEKEKIIFAPDRNLGNYIKSKTGRDMLIWDGACHVHEEFSLEGILELKKQLPDAKILVHPECELPVRMVADYIGSTSGILSFSETGGAKNYIVATEPGILHQMKKLCPDKNFIPAPPKDSTCGCNDCNYMKLITLEKIYLTLKYELPEVILDNELMNKARKPITRMLEISKNLGL